MRRGATGAEGAPLAGDPHQLLRAERASATPRGPAVSQPAAPRQARRAPAVGPVAATAGAGELARLQRWFLAIISHPGSIADGIAGAAQASGARLDHRSALISTPELGSQERLGVYHYAYAARLVDCLADDFPAVRELLGEPDFDALCRAVIAERPSRTPNLNAYGAALAAHCTARVDSSGRSAFVAELARLEWAMVEVFHAVDAPALDPAALAAVPMERWATMRFAPGPHLRLLRCRYPVHAYYQAWRTDRAPSVPKRKRSSIAVYRERDRIWRMELDEGRADLLSALLAGAPLGDALGTRRSSARMLTVETVMRSFQDWVGHGFFAPLI